VSDIKYEESKRARDDARARVAMGKSRGDQTTCAARTARRHSSVSESNADGDFTTGARRERVRLSLSGGEEIHHASEQV